MSGEANDFYETSQARDSRFVSLLQAVSNDTAWVRGFIPFLRDKANLRSASVVAAAEIVHARLAAGLPDNRSLISAALQRPDEPGELLAYWSAKYGRNFPMPVKRGVADAVQRMWTEKSYLKWDSESKGWKFADVLQVVHPSPRGEWQDSLFKFVLDERFQGVAALPAATLPVIRARKALQALPLEERRSVTAGQLAEAGMTWEAVSGWVQGEMDAAMWEKIIPSMGVMALLRNLRNFDKVGIDKATRRLVENVLTDPEKISSSRQLPMRFLSAYRATQSSGTVTAWGPAIEEALNLSLANVPQLDGRTLVLVDLSGSMQDNIAGSRTDLSRKDGAAVFGAALAKRSQAADLYGFDTSLYQFDLSKFNSVLPLANSITGYGGGGTATGDALAATYNASVHDRVVILTDEQTGYGWGHGLRSLPEVLNGIKVPVYTWNLAGYQAAHAESGKNRHTFGGLSDSAFRMVQLLEAGISADWDKLFS